ncbi:MAG: hypothetical protein AAB874_06130 [Patescibacteria group bacterium]
MSSPKGVTLCIIPPPGTQIGDQITHGAGIGYGDQAALTFESPKGRLRGMAKLFGITNDQAKELRERMKAVLENL